MSYLAYADSMAERIRSIESPIAKIVDVDISADLSDRDAGFKKEFYIVLGNVSYERKTAIVYRDTILETDVLLDSHSSSLVVSVKEEDVVPNHMMVIDHSEIFFDRVPLRFGEKRSRHVGNDIISVKVYPAKTINGAELIERIRAVVNGCTLTRGDGGAYRNYKYTNGELCTTLENALKILKGIGFNRSELGQLVREIGPRGIKASLLKSLLDSIER